MCTCLLKSYTRAGGKIHRVTFLTAPSSKPVPLAPMVGEARMLGCSISPGTRVRDGTEGRGSVQVDMPARTTFVSQVWACRRRHTPWYGRCFETCDLATPLISHCDIPQSALSAPPPSQQPKGARKPAELVPGSKHFGTNASPPITSYSHGRTRLSLLLIPCRLYQDERDTLVHLNV